jgi:hypothetical protein
VPLAAAYAAALESEAKDSTSAEPYLALLDRVVAEPDAPLAIAAAAAALDALTSSSAGGLDGAPTAVVFRSRELLPRVVERLSGAWAAAAPREESSGSRPEALPIVRGMIATALHALALYTGETQAAATWASRRGCAQTATVLGPLAYPPLVGLDAPTPAGPEQPIAPAYPGVPPFGAAVAPVRVHADQCLLDVSGASFLQGTRAVVVDLAVSRAQTIYLALTSTSAAVVEVGGVRAMRRAFDAGGRATTQFASARVPVGTVRVVVRVAQKGDGGQIELDAWGDDGLPLRAHAPRVGEVARARAISAAPIDIDIDIDIDKEAPVGPHRSPEQVMLTTAGLLGLGEARAAEHLLEQVSATGAAATGLALLDARAVEAADDLPDAKAFERTRADIDRVLAAWPTSWEAILGHARATERRRGSGDGPAEALRELGSRPDGAREDEVRGSSSVAPIPRDRMVTAYAALLGKRAGLIDFAADDYAELQRVAAGSPLLAAVDARVYPRSGPDALVAACRSARSHADLDCFDAERDQGLFLAALAELDRLRTLRGAPEALRDLEIATRILAGDPRGALAVYEAMHPGERRLLDVPAYLGARGDLHGARRLALRDMLTARDAPFAIDPLSRLLGLTPDPAPELEADGKRLVAADRAAAYAPGAATAVLRRLERYELAETGLLHYITYDLRRVSGTTDVASGGVTYGASIEGRSAPRLLRRRIHKRDGRVLEPDAAANSAQVSDLSQLEQGDYIEQIVEGWALPGDTGQIVVDTPDLLPERTSVREATVILKRPAALALALWSHPLLGKADEHVEGPVKVSVFRLVDRAPRRLESGEPLMERSVSLSFGTQTWANVARAVEENIRSLDERDPLVARFAREAAGALRVPSRALLSRIVTAAGKKIKIASPAELTDAAALYSGGPQRTSARAILELGQGSRAWVIYRALRELGVKVDLVIAETEPWSASADFPAHAGRFRHPLVVASLPAASGDKADKADKADEVWIDADVEGPPLPPGRISPELRGRSALLASGAMVKVAGASGETGDEVDVRLALDGKGDARGTFTVMLHGRSAQALSEAFETVVGTDRQEMLRGVVLGWLPWADVEEVNVSSTEGSWEVALRASIAMPGYGRPEGKDGTTWVLAGLEPVHFVVPRSFAGSLAATYASRAARQSALSIDVPLQYHVHRRVELPAGAVATRTPLPVSVDGPLLRADRKTEVTGKVIEDDFALSLPTGTVDASGYQAFVTRVQAVDAGFMAGTRVTVSAGAVGGIGASGGSLAPAPAGKGKP